MNDKVLDLRDVRGVKSVGLHPTGLAVVHTEAGNVLLVREDEGSYSIRTNDNVSVSMLDWRQVMIAVREFAYSPGGV